MQDRFQEISSLPEVAEHQGRRAIIGDGKEVAGADGIELRRASAQSPEGPQTSDVDAPEAVVGTAEREIDDVTPKRQSRKRRILVFAAIMFILCLTIGLGVGLGVGLNSNNNRGSHNRSSDNSDPTARGALNGTDIAWTGAYQTTNLSTHQPSTDDYWNQDDKFLFFQHHTGSIRWMYQYSPDGWRGGSRSEIVATDAKMGTPIDAMTPSGHDTLLYDVYYVNSDNYLRQRSMNTSAYTWTDGPLHKLNIKVLDADRVGMRACLYLGPISGVSSEETRGHGVRLFVAVDGTSFEQYARFNGMDQWVFEQRWTNMNGRASPACFGWGKGHTFYTWFVNSGNTINMWWIDTANNTSTATHPINSWAQSSLDFPAVDPLPGIDFQYIMYGRLATGETYGWNMTLDAENSTLGNTTLSTIDLSSPAANSRLAVAATPPFGGGGKHDKLINVFCQVESDDITMFTGDRETGTWSSYKLPIPDD